MALVTKIGIIGASHVGAHVAEARLLTRDLQLSSH